MAILPALTTLVLLGHLLFVQFWGMSVPPGIERRGGERRGMRFFPHFALRELFGWMLALAVLAALAALFPWELGEKADPFAPAYKDIRPEWYFVFMFETLKLVPGGELAGIEAEAIPILAFGLAAILLVLVPFLDRRVNRDGRSPAFTAIGIVALVYMVGMTAWGYRSLVPVWVVAGTAALIWILSWGVASPRGRLEP